jgi:FkbM family methyltransferase
MLRRLGYDLHSLPVGSLTLRDLEFDLCYLVKGPNPVVLDVGANAGQSIDLFRRTLANPTIISFEADPALAADLKRKYADSGIVVEATALGSSEGTSRFNVSDIHRLSSILEVHRTDEHPFSKISMNSVINVPVTTLDSYVNKYDLVRIDLLKIKTLGFDLEVLRGAAEMLRRQAVDTLLVQIFFAPVYIGQANFGEIERFLAEKGYALLCFYEVTRPNLCIGWVTACFRPEKYFTGDWAA